MEVTMGIVGTPCGCGGDPGGGAEATVIGPLFQQGDDVRESVAFCGTFCPKHQSFVALETSTWFLRPWALFWTSHLGPSSLFFSIGRTWLLEQPLFPGGLWYLARRRLQEGDVLGPPGAPSTSLRDAHR